MKDYTKQREVMNLAHDIDLMGKHYDYNNILLNDNILCKLPEQSRLSIRSSIYKQTVSSMIEKKLGITESIFKLDEDKLQEYKLELTRVKLSIQNDFGHQRQLLFGRRLKAGYDRGGATI